MNDAHDHRYYTLTGIRNGDVIVVGLVHLQTGCPRKECRMCGKVMKSSSYAWSEVSMFSWLIIRVLCAASLISWFIRSLLVGQKKNERHMRTPIFCGTVSSSAFTPLHHNVL